MCPTVTSRLQRQIEWLLLAVFSTLFAAHTMPRAWRTLNTDFPNYYLAASLAHEQYDLTHVYEWRWLQREKDHRAIDQRVIGLVPITPFSTLFVYPLTGFAPLTAKHLWLLLQLALLIPIGLILRSLTGQPLRRIALLMAACMPLHRNLLYGQFYIPLLGMLVLACWAYRRQYSALSGALIAVAAMTKIFPIIFFLYFLRRKDWRALLSGFGTLALTGIASIAVFGWSVHRTYLRVILPWTLRGEALPPFNLASSSISTVLHRLFLYEPQWNPRPWHNAPYLAAVLGPLLQMLLLAPAVLLLSPNSKDRDSSPLEWSALITAILAISTVPASYNFTLLILPIVVLCGYLKPRPGFIAVLLFLAICYPAWNTSPAEGLRVLLHVPRMFFLIGFTLLTAWALASTPQYRQFRFSRHWAVGLSLFTLVGIITGLRHQQNLFSDYPYRLVTSPNVLMAASPDAFGSAVSLTSNGYRIVPNRIADSSDQLSFASTSHGDWVEDVSESSTLVPPPGSMQAAIPNARAPILSRSGELIAYLRDDRGRGRLYAINQAVPITPTDFNVEEAAALEDGSFVFAATTSNEASHLFLTHGGGTLTAMNLGEARYPALSSDGRYLAYSRFEAGAWNLWLLSRDTGHSERLTQAPCNQIEPVWEPDSKTLLYASDCGRALWFTALCRRHFIK
jgi:hypothetical protein